MKLKTRQRRRRAASHTQNLPGQLDLLAWVRPKRKKCKALRRTRVRPIPRHERHLRAGPFAYREIKTGHFCGPPRPKDIIKPRGRVGRIMRAAVLAGATIVVPGNIRPSIKARIDTPIGPWTIEVSPTLPGKH